jgi:dTDP-4-amino-4,6-dideoxygalactose transaminase
MRIPLVDLKRHYQPLKGEILAGMAQVLDGMNLFLGKNVQTLESDFATYCRTDFAIGVGSGTEALHLALIACGIKPGDEVITVSHTFFATAGAIIQAGARPVFVDVEEETYNMDPGQLESAITPRTRAIIPVHLYGHPVNMAPVLEIARARRLKVIEDACQAHGAEFKGRRAGSMGDAGCFSFYYTKNLGAYGEAGAITTSDPEIALRCRTLRDHGQESKYIHSTFGINGRLDELQAAVLRVKLPHLDRWNEARRTIAAAYNDGLPSDIVKPREMPWARHVYHQYVIRPPDRDRLRNWLDSKGVGTGMHYPVPIHLQKAWSDYSETRFSLPITEKVAGEILSLPMFPELSTEEVAYICDCVTEFTASRVTASIKK